MRLLIVCHVETGAVRRRDIVFDRNRVEGVQDAMPHIVEFAERHAIPLVAAFTPQALSLLETDVTGLGTGLHLHPLDPVLASRVGNRVSIESDCLRHYPVDAQRRLLGAASDLFLEKIGRPPRFFVAGNWSESEDTLQVLEERRFQWDGSPLPGHTSSCADWSHLGRLAQPYRSRGVLCIPVFRTLWGDYLTPETLHIHGVSLFKAALKEASVASMRTVHIYFHSPMALDPFFLEGFAEAMDFARDNLGGKMIGPEAVEPSDGKPSRGFPPAYLAYLDLPMIKSLLVRNFPTFAPDRRRPRGSGPDKS